MRKALIAVSAVIIASASAAIGWFGVQWLGIGSNDPMPENPVASGSPTAAPADTVPLSWSLSAASGLVAGLFETPDCGAEWSSSATETYGIVPVVTATADAESATVSASVTLTASSEELQSFLATTSNVIVTRDGIVVTPAWGPEFVPELHQAATGSDSDASTPVVFGASELCDREEEFNALFDGFDFGGATDEELAAQQAKIDEWNAANSEFPAGEYKVYAWTPVEFGTQAAIASVLYDEGISDLAYLQYTAAYSPIADDPRIAPYCQDGSAGDRLCDIPEDVLAEVLTRNVPTSAIVDRDPAVVISEAAVFVVE
jgi:hypothetical protein